MALKKFLTTGSGIDCANSYIMVKKITVYKDQQAVCEFWAFKDQEARSLDLEPINKFEISFPFDIEVKENIAKQAYLALKQLPSYSDSVDV